MQELRVFESTEFGELGVLKIAEKEYFPATACAKMLGYKRPADAITAHCKGSVKRRVLTGGGEQELKFIPEGDLYRLIVSSKLPSAERFEKWVFDEVLPSIRKTGGYGVPDLEKVITQTAVAVATEIMKQLIPALSCLMTQPRQAQPANRSDMPVPAPHEFGSPRCKLETFPTPIVDQVDQMMLDMMQQQALNFSYIARWCTLNGYTISSPSVKTYYDRRFGAN